MIEGLEVVFIVIAVGAGRGLLIPASLGALAACLLVLVIRRARPSAARECSREHAEVLRRRDAGSFGGVLDGRGARYRLAGRRSGHSHLHRYVSDNGADPG